MIQHDRVLYIRIVLGHRGTWKWTWTLTAGYSSGKTRLRLSHSSSPRTFTYRHSSNLYLKAQTHHLSLSLSIIDSRGFISVLIILEGPFILCCVHLPCQCCILPF